MPHFGLLAVIVVSLCKCILVPARSVNQDAGLPRLGLEPLEVTLNVFSGVKNPTWTVYPSDSLHQTLFSLLHQYESTPLPSILGYSGFEIHGSANRGSGLSQAVAAGSGRDLETILLYTGLRSNEPTTVEIVQELLCKETSDETFCKALPIAASSASPTTTEPSSFMTTGFTSPMPTDASQDSTTGYSSPMTTDSSSQTTTDSSTSTPTDSSTATTTDSSTSMTSGPSTSTTTDSYSPTTTDPSTSTTTDSSSQTTTGFTSSTTTDPSSSAAASSFSPTQTDPSSATTWSSSSSQTSQSTTPTYSSSTQTSSSQTTRTTSPQTTSPVSTSTPATTPKPCICPKYKPGKWNNDPNDKANNNCYNYATDSKTGTFAQPGRGSGKPYTSLTGPAVRDAAVRDGLKVVTKPTSVKKGECLVALVVWPGKDFHWYRRDANGKWSHKPGSTAATNKDNSGKVIKDPRTADIGMYKFVTFMSYCPGKITVKK